MPDTPIKLKNGLRIDFRTTSGEPLNYLRFENTITDDGIPNYVGAIECNEKLKLRKLRDAINYLLRIKS